MKTLLTLKLLAFSMTIAYAAPLNVKKGLAIKGYDPVSYFTGDPTKGSTEFTANHAGATYQFSTAVNRDLFQKQPSKYTPQYGGYCAYGIGIGKLIKINPEVYVIHNGKLYLNYSRSVAKKYEKNLTGSIAGSDKEWTKLSK